MIVAWTGHRPDLFRECGRVQATVSDTLRALVHAGDIEQFLVGGQRGVDTWAAQAAIEAGAPFTLGLPCDVPEFTADWPPADRQLLEQHAALASAVHIADGYTARNRWLAASANLLIAVWTGRAGGGTAETVAFARELGTPIRDIRVAGAATAGPVTGRGI
jgi:hypothetical protein